MADLLLIEFGSVAERARIVIASAKLCRGTRNASSPADTLFTKRRLPDLRRATNSHYQTLRKRAAVYREDGAGDLSGCWCREESNCSRNVFRLVKAAKGAETTLIVGKFARLGNSSPCL